MKAQELKEMSIEELKAHQETLLDELAGLRVKLVLRQLDNPMRVRALRKNIARARTIIRQKEIAAR